MVIPPSFRVPFLLRALDPGKIGAFLAEAHSVASKEPDNDEALQNLRQICRGIAFDQIHNKDRTTEICISVFQIALEFGYPEVLTQCLNRLGGDLSELIGSDLGKAILSLGFPKFQLV